jgi:hypothetical protein
METGTAVWRVAEVVDGEAFGAEALDNFRIIGIPPAGCNVDHKVVSACRVQRYRFPPTNKKPADFQRASVVLGTNVEKRRERYKEKEGNQTTYLIPLCYDVSLDH